MSQEVLNPPVANASDKQIVVEAMQRLPEQDRQDIIQEFKPAPQVINLVWIVIVISFALILVGAFVTLALAVFTYGKLSGDLLLTVFTTAAAFLAGLLTPGPNQTKSGQ